MTFFLPERDLFYEIDQIFYQNVGLYGWNVRFRAPLVGIWRGWLGSEVWFSGPKFWENAQNGSSQKWCQIGRNYFLGRDIAVFIFWGLKLSAPAFGS